MIRLGVNGLGRIGRQVLNAFLTRYPESLQVVAVNDLFDVETNAHLFTGPFLTGAKAAAHLAGGSKMVITSAPAKDEDLTVVMGVNHKQYNPRKHRIVSNAPCTTHCLAPPVTVVHNAFGSEKGMMATVHSYTNDKRILDLPHQDLRRARAAAMNIIPTSTGAAMALPLVIPERAGRFDRYSLRIPTPTVSNVDFTAELRTKTTTEEPLQTLCAAAKKPSGGSWPVRRRRLSPWISGGMPIPRSSTWNSPRS